MGLNYLLKCKAVNEIFDEESKKGYTNAHIYRTHIRDAFYISERAFYRALKVDYESELKALNYEHTQSETQCGGTKKGDKQQNR